MNAGWVIALSIAIGIPWRFVTWRRYGGDKVREVGVALLYLWSLVVVYFTLFPLNIIFYDWHGRLSLIPFASTVQLITETNPTISFRNIVGNLLLLVPVGALLPLLFEPLRRFWPVVWRVALISATIETAQLITRARAVDIDDVIFNTTGAAFGFALYWMGARLLRKTSGGSRFLDRLGDHPRREPLTLAAIPVLLTAAIAVPIMISMIVSATLGEGSTGIEADATSNWPGSRVVARGDIGTDTLLVVSSDEGGLERLGFAGYEKVLPGRYTWVVRSDLWQIEGSQYGWSISAYNTAIGELPTIYIWGSNRADSVRLVVSGNGVTEELALPPQPYFAVGFKYQPDPTVAIMEKFDFQFFDASGANLTEFTSISG